MSEVEGAVGILSDSEEFIGVDFSADGSADGSSDVSVVSDLADFAGSLPEEVGSNIDSYFSQSDIDKAKESGDIYDLIRTVGLDKKKSYLDTCSQLTSRDMLLAVLIANGMELDIAYLKAIHFDNPEKYLLKKSILMRECRNYISDREKLCVAIVELRDTALDQYSERSKINKNLIMNEIMKLKDYCLESPLTYKIALDSLRLIGDELGMFGKNSTNKVLGHVNEPITINTTVGSRIDELMESGDNADTVSESEVVSEVSADVVEKK